MYVACSVLRWTTLGDGIILHRKKELDEMTKARLKKSAFELGLEVGEKGHIENVGWVHSELRFLMQQAEENGITDEVKQKYEMAKQIGVRNRSKIAFQPGKSLGKIDPSTGPPVSAAKKVHGAASVSKGGFVERIPPEVGLRSTASVIKFAGKSPEVRKDLDNLFSGIADVNEMLGDVESSPNPKVTFERSLSLLKELGWLDGFEIGKFDDEAVTVSLWTTSHLPRHVGSSDGPVCKPLCTLLETIGRKTFGRSVTVTESECIAQGHSECEFKLVARPE